ncbi:MAG TPA: response regulator [Stellaceae bacterium]|nr:response regulator [Stellaceae bacterium]
MYPEGQPILLIDNAGERRQLCERILRDAGFAVTAAAEGVTAIRAAAAGRFALAVAAMDLPGMLDGPTTVRQIRARQPWLKALYTGDVARRPFLRGRGRDEFIPSPFHRRDLLGCVFELLHREIPAATEEWSGRRAG